MASIIKRGKSYCVVYDYVNSDGQRKQKWETFPSRKEASVRKSEVELAQKKGTFLPPSAETVAEFMDEFVRLYGELKWSPSMYDSSTGIIRNYINPLIGNLPMQSVTVKTVDIFIHDLHRTRSAAEKYHAVKQDYISDSQVEKVFKLARPINFLNLSENYDFMSRWLGVYDKYAKLLKGSSDAVVKDTSRD